MPAQPNLQQLMAQAQKMQQQMMAGQAELAETQVTGETAGGLVKAVVTAANVHDSQVLEELVDAGDLVVYADSAYKSAAIDAALAAKNVEAQINEKGTRGHPLTEQQKAANRHRREEVAK